MVVVEGCELECICVVIEVGVGICVGSVVVFNEVCIIVIDDVLLLDWL